MPTVWQNLSAPQCQNIMAILDSFYKSQKPWLKSNVYQLCEHVSLQNVAKLCDCYLFVKDNPSLVLDPENEPAKDSVRGTRKTTMASLGSPRNCLVMLVGGAVDKGRKKRAFNQVSNHVAMHHDHGDRLTVLLSSSSTLVVLTW